MTQFLTREFSWLSLIVWMAPNTYATEPKFYHFLLFVLLIMVLLAEINYWLEKYLEGKENGKT